MGILTEHIKEYQKQRPVTTFIRKEYGTLIEQLNDSQITYPNVPFITLCDDLMMERVVNGDESMVELYEQTIHRHLSSIPEYQCRICGDSIPHEFSERHIRYSCLVLTDGGLDLLSEHIFGCCESCSKKIANSEITSTGEPYVVNPIDSDFLVRNEMFRMNETIKDKFSQFSQFSLDEGSPIIKYEDVFGKYIKQIENKNWEVVIDYSIKDGDDIFFRLLDYCFQNDILSKTGCRDLYCERSGRLNTIKN